MAKAATVKTGTAPKTAAKANKAAQEAAPQDSKKAPPAREVEIVMPSKKAMQIDIGARIAQNLAEVYTRQHELTVARSENQKKEYDTLAQLTMGIVKAAEHDAHIADTLSDVFSGEQKQINALNEVLMLAMGIREVVPIKTKDGKTVNKVQYVKAVWELFPTPNDAKGSEEYTRKNTLRSNFLHQMKKAIQAAVGIRDSNISAKIDNKSGTLLLEGPAVRKHFGRDTVLLDEKQKIKTGEGDNVQVTELKARPSFTEIARLGGSLHGKTVTQRKDSRAAVVGNADDAIAGVCESLVKALANYKGEYTDKVRKGLASAANAINTYVEKHSTKEAA